jgi:hypothetical protein
MLTLTGIESCALAPRSTCGREIAAAGAANLPTVRRETRLASTSLAPHRGAGHRNCRHRREPENSWRPASTNARRARSPQTAAHEAQSEPAAHRRDALKSTPLSCRSWHIYIPRRFCNMQLGTHCYFAMTSASSASLASALYAAPISTTSAVTYIHSSNPIAAANPPYTTS